HGKNFFMDEFGVDVRSVWLPDVFGYSASMPQIMLKAGCDYFLTQKLSWSQVNTFPYSSFRWSGIDGSEVLVHFPPENNYNSNCCPSMRKHGADNFQEAGIADEFMSLFGIGDGGGGPSEDYVERNERVKDLEGCPKAAYGKSADFFNRLDKIRNELPIWKGELYLELHRGTLTTQARTKRNNRKCEQALQQLEALASLLPTAFYPDSKLDTAWKSLLVNQFHDILPGSAIRQVYETTEKQHAAILEMCRGETAAAARLLFTENAETAVVANTLSCPWQGCIELPCDWAGFEFIDDNGKTCPSQLEGDRFFVYIEAEGLSFLTLCRGRKRATASVVAQSDGTGLVLENGIVRYTFNDQGQLVSAVDMREDREILTDAGNILSLYHDRPFHFEAWEVDIFYPRDVMGTLPCVKAEGPFCGEARSTLKFTYRTEASTVVQTVSLTPHTTRLDFITHADWHESRKMLRASFPVAIASNEATFDIQYGYVRRPTHDNTSWEQAKFEVVGQRYADFSQDDYGTALLNDCKYGYRMKGSVMDINLLRSPRYPDYFADQGEHDFVYSFYPHTGDHVAGNVAEVSAMLNRPPVVAVGFEANNVEFPCHVVAGHASIETLKKAEKDDSRIIRIVETAGKHGNVVLRFAQEVKRVSETNLLEWEHGRELQMNERTVTLKMKPFEIVTLRIE
ncbi:MAG: alpha-mannosidase, partial [Victivallales bacterium]|nr:alpha-mannosidase [Victivallales bacterium]